jgi:hypothetical protein
MDDGAMTDASPPRYPVAGPGFPRVALGFAWFGSALGTGVVGWLVDGLPGKLLAGGGVLAVVALGAVVSNRGRRVTLALSSLVGTILIVIGVVAAVLAAVAGDLDPAEVVAMGAAPVAGGLLSRRLSRRAQRLAQ